MVPSPSIREARLHYQPLAWAAWDVAHPRVVIQAIGINEYQARVDAGITLGLPAWRVRVRPAIASLGLA